MKTVGVPLVSLLLFLMLVSCDNQTLRNPSNQAADSFDKNSMKGSWQFVSATDGKTYGNIEIKSIGATSFSPYENSWLNPNPWYETISGEVFAIKVEENDLRNILFDASSRYIGDTKTVELYACSSALGGTMKFKNVTDDVTYSYTRTSQ